MSRNVGVRRSASLSQWGSLSSSVVGRQTPMRPPDLAPVIDFVLGIVQPLGTIIAGGGCPGRIPIAHCYRDRDPTAPDYRRMGVPYRIRGLKTKSPRRAFGVHAIQALELVLQAIRLELEPHGSKVAWAGEAGEIGFSRFFQTYSVRRCAAV